MKNILLVSALNQFEANLLSCLNESYKIIVRPDILSFQLEKFLEKNKVETVIINLLRERQNTRREIRCLIKQKIIKKFLMLERAQELYLGSHSSVPFSVYKRLTPRNLKSRIIKKREDLIKNSGKDYVVFRVSEMYGKHVNFGLVHDLLRKNQVKLNEGEKDFVYEGDVVHAIEIALENSATGVFDIAYGKSIDMKQLVNLVNGYRQNKIKIQWRKQIININYNCENFKFYKWNPLVNITSGLRVMNLQNKKKNV